MPAFLKALAGLALLPALGSMTGQQVYDVPADPRIVLVDCERTLGTAFRVGPNLLISARHVTAGKGCRVEGRPIRELYSDGDKDFSMVALREIYGASNMEIDCRGFRPGRAYLAIGHARGLDQLRAVVLEGTGGHDEDSGLALLKGVATVIPGQSGGPVVDEISGRVVGVVNTYNAASGYSGSRELSDTPLCRKS